MNRSSNDNMDNEKQTLLLQSEDDSNYTETDGATTYGSVVRRLSQQVNTVTRRLSDTVADAVREELLDLHDAAMDELEQVVVQRDPTLLLEVDLVRSGLPITSDGMHEIATSMRQQQLRSRRLSQGSTNHISYNLLYQDSDTHCDQHHRYQRTSSLLSLAIPLERSTSSTKSLDHMDDCSSGSTQQSDDVASINIRIQRSPAALKVAPLRAWLLLASAVVALSALGPMLNLQNDVDDPILKMQWRVALTAVLMLPLALKALICDGEIKRLSTRQLIAIILTALCYAGVIGFYVLALEYTSVGTALIFANSQTLILLVAKVLMGSPMRPVELLGALVAFSGATLCSFDSASEDGSGNHGGSINTVARGDFLGLLSAISGVGYLVCAKTVGPPVVPTDILMFLIMSLSAVVLFVYDLIMFDGLTLDADPHHGLWGWMTWHQFPKTLFMAGICNVFGAIGYVRALRYFDTLVVSTATLLEPVSGELLNAMIEGPSGLPGTMGWFGNSLVILGTFAVLQASAKKPQRDEPLLKDVVTIDV